MNVSSLLVSNPQPAVGKEPGECGFDYPSVLAQATAVFGVALGNEWFDASRSQRPADLFLGVVRSIGKEAFRTLARPTARTLDRLNRIDQSDRHHGIVDIRAGVFNGQRRAVAVRDQMALGAVLAAICRVRPGLRPPKSARVEQLSMIAVDQSISSAWPSSSSNARQMSSQTPAWCQSRRRRQQVIPDPQPISCGKYSHGMPVLSTKMMPVRHARSGIAGRPPSGRGGRGGMNGSIRSQSSSMSSGLAITRSSMTYAACRPCHGSVRTFC